MIKKIMWLYWRNDYETDAEFEAQYYLYKTSFAVQWFVIQRMFFYWLSALSMCITSLILIHQTDKITLSDWIVSILLAFVFLIFFYKVPKKKIIEALDNKYKANSDKLFTFFFKFFTLYNNKVIPIKIWKKIKKHYKELYLDLTSDECNHLCYYYSLVLGLILKNVNLIWGGVYCPIKRCWYAHAFIEKNGYVYDSNHRLSYKFEDYAKAQNLKIYKKWSYKDFGIQDFRSSVRQDFYKWCEENNITTYSCF